MLPTATFQQLAPYVNFTKLRVKTVEERVAERLGIGPALSFGPRVRVINFDEHTIEKLRLASKITKNFAILGPIGQYIRKTAQKLIEYDDEPSKPGEPPHTQTQLLYNSILWARSPHRPGVIVGPAYSRIGDVMAVHEFGLHRFGRSYPKRPFMGPALRRASRFLPNIWKKYL